MTEKRFKLYEHKGNDYILDNPKEHLDFIEMLGDTLTSEEIVDLLNELHDEKERWKSMSVATSNEKEILWNEVHILMEQGAEPSDAFKKYLESISTEHTKFWQRKLEKAKKDGVIE